MHASDFDHAQRRLTVFRKGGKVQTIPVVDLAFWNELERWILDWEAQPNEYLLCRRTVRPNRHKHGQRFVQEYRDQPMGGHGLHDWWYACLEPVSSPRARGAARGCTRPGTPPASAS